MIDIHSAKLIQRVKPLNYVAKDCMLTVEIFDVVREGNEELAAATTQSPPVCSGRDRHGDRTFILVLESGEQLRHEVA